MPEGSQSTAQVRRRPHHASCDSWHEICSPCPRSGSQYQGRQSLWIFWRFFIMTDTARTKFPGDTVQAARHPNHGDPGFNGGRRPGFDQALSTCATGTGRVPGAWRRVSSELEVEALVIAAEWRGGVAMPPFRKSARPEKSGGSRFPEAPWLGFNRSGQAWSGFGCIRVVCWTSPPCE